MKEKIKKSIDIHFFFHIYKKLQLNFKCTQETNTKNKYKINKNKQNY